MSDTVSLAEARAVKNNDARLWTPLDCLKALVRELESGEMGPVDAVYVAMLRKDESGQACAFPFYVARTTMIESRGILAQHLHDCCASFGEKK